MAFEKMSEGEIKSKQNQIDTSNQTKASPIGGAPSIKPGGKASSGKGKESGFHGNKKC
jgi:hypothetical protein